MDIRERVNHLLRRMPGVPQYSSQGVVLFIDLEKCQTRSGYLPQEVYRTFLGGRGANMFLLYNLMQECLDPLDPQIPLIFGTGVLTGHTFTAARGNVTSLSPESDAFLDSNAGDYFPAYMRLHGIDHVVIYGRNAQWKLLDINDGDISFMNASPYLGLNNIDLTAAIERDLHCTERVDMAMARITSAGENQVLCSGIMAGPKAIWARGGAGAKMGALGLKAVTIRGKPGKPKVSAQFHKDNRQLGKQILASSVVRNALKTVGTPFLYKPSRLLGAMGTMNNQHTTWVDKLDADRLDDYRTGMDGCYKCPVYCRPLNDMTPGAKGGWGAASLKGATGNLSYGKEPSAGPVEQTRSIPHKEAYDRYDKGDGPEYVTVGKFGPNIGMEEPWQVLRLNNIVNDLGLDSASTGSAIGWAMELYQTGVIDKGTTGGLELTWGNYPVVEKLLFMTATREGFGDVVADSARAVSTGKYPEQALCCRMAVKGLFQSDPHDSRILKAFALGLAVATRGMDHLRNRVTLEINARINDDKAFKAELYGGEVAAEPNKYLGKEYAVRRCEDVFAVGDSVGMCRFDTKLFNSPSLPGCEEFTKQLQELTGVEMNTEQLYQIGRNITALERMINARLGLNADDDTLPDRWFDEPNDAGPFQGEKIDRDEFSAMKQRFYKISGFNHRGLPDVKWHERLARIATGFAMTVGLPEMPGFDQRLIVIDESPSDIEGLRARIKLQFPETREYLDDFSLGVSVNDELLITGEQGRKLESGDHVEFVPVIAGG